MQVKEDAASSHAAFVGASVKFDADLRKQEAAHKSHLQTETHRADGALREAADVRLTCSDLKARLGKAEAEKEEMGRRYEEKECEVALEKGIMEEVELLRITVQELTAMNTELLEKTSGLGVRYQEGRLVTIHTPRKRVLRLTRFLQTDEEKDFVNSVVQMTKSIQEQDLVAKGNELRRVPSS